MVSASIIIQRLYSDLRGTVISFTTFTTMAYHITWLIGAILIAHNFESIMTGAVPEKEEAPRSLFNGLKQFSLEFYQKAIGGTDNLICSPLSVGVVLSMAAYGARGNTEKQMRPALHMHENNEFGRYSFRTLIDSLHKTDTIVLKLANKIFLEKGIELKPDFEDITKNDFQSPIQTVEFTDSAQTAETINSWSANNTNDRIKKVVNADDVQNAKMVMVNALYFKGDWVSPFKNFMTQPKPFHVDEKTTKNVDTMYQQSHFNYGTLPELDAVYIELPYVAMNNYEGTSMIIILPNAIDGLKKTEESLSKVNLRQLYSNQDSKLINLWLPKFKIESTINVKEILEKLGMTDMFTDQADFTGITDNPPLKVSKVIQKAFIEVDEKGSEAAAVTALVAVPMSAPMFPTPPIDVKVDHPFAFILYHYDTDTILFQGHVTLPSK